MSDTPDEPRPSARSPYTSLEQAALFRQAADLIEKYGWCKKVVARDLHRHFVPVESPSALSFCVIGALYRIMGAEEGARLATGFTHYLQEERQIRPLIPDQAALILLGHWNDTRQNRLQVLHWMRGYADRLEAASP